MRVGLGILAGWLIGETNDFEGRLLRMGIWLLRNDIFRWSVNCYGGGAADIGLVWM